METEAATSLSSFSSSSSLSDLEAGVSNTLPFPYSIRRKMSYKYMKSHSPSPRSVTAMFFYDSFDDDEPHHFLDSCFLCKKPLGSNRDIFMYRGNTPFCSEECRQEQIEMDEAADEKNKKASSAVRGYEKKSSAARRRAHYGAGTVVAG